MVVGIGNDQEPLQIRLSLVGLQIGLIEVDHEQRQVGLEVGRVLVQAVGPGVDSVSQVALAALEAAEEQIASRLVETESGLGSLIFVDFEELDGRRVVEEGSAHEAVALAGSVGNARNDLVDGGWSGDLAG